MKHYKWLEKNIMNNGVSNEHAYIRMIFGQSDHKHGET